MERSLDFLAADWRDEPERHHSMHAVFDATWGMLTEGERQVFVRLSVFRGGFTRDAAQAVAGADLRTLMSLATKSLLQRDQSGRYEVHELLRQYGAGQLARAPEEEHAARDRHCAYYIAALEQWAVELRELGGQRWADLRALLPVEIANAWAAWEWAVAQGREEQLAQGIDGLYLFCDWYGGYQEGVAAFEAAATRLREAGRGSARVLLRLATAQLALVQDAESWQHLFRRCQDLLAHPDLAGQDVRREEAEFCRRVAAPTVWMLPDEEARAYAQRAMALYQELANRLGMADVHGILGLYAVFSGDHGEARRQLAQELELSRSSGYLGGVLGSIWWSAMVAFSQGLAQECNGWVREWSAALGGPVQHDGSGLWMAGKADLLSGCYVQAGTALQECAAIFRSSGGAVYLGRMLPLLAMAQMHLGQYGQAVASAEEGVALNRENGSRTNEGWCLGVLACVALVEGRDRAAVDLLNLAIAIYRAGRVLSWLGEALAFIGHAARRLAQKTEARQHVAEGLRLGLEVRSLLPLWAALPVVALLEADCGEAERAAELYALGWSVPHIAQSRWYEDVAGRELAAVVAGLPRQVREAALARGRARGMWATAEELVAGLDPRASLSAVSGESAEAHPVAGEGGGGHDDD
jgi:tetratricopeptide (TPR) repeat protein